MSKYDKAVKKLLNEQVVLTVQDLHSVLSGLGYEEKKTGKTSGSRMAYINPDTKHIIRIHKPRPGNELKTYIKQFIIKELKNQNLL